MRRGLFGGGDIQQRLEGKQGVGCECRSQGKDFHAHGNKISYPGLQSTCDLSETGREVFCFSVLVSSFTSMPLCPAVALFTGPVRHPGLCSPLFKISLHFGHFSVIPGF